jgi:acid phosphatase family membrane protein YuiD
VAMLFVRSQARHAVDFQSVRRAGLVSRVGGILSAQRAAVLAVADSYAIPDGSASRPVVVSFVNSAEEMVLHL